MTTNTNGPRFQDLPSGRIVFAATRAGAVRKCWDRQEDAIAQMEGVKGSDAYLGRDRSIGRDHQDCGPTTYKVETLQWNGTGWTRLAVIDITIGPAQKWL